MKSLQFFTSYVNLDEMINIRLLGHHIGLGTAGGARQWLLDPTLFDLQALRSRGKTVKSRGQIVITWSNKNNNIVCLYSHIRQVFSTRTIAVKAKVSGITIYRNGPERTETDFSVPRKSVSVSTKVRFGPSRSVSVRSGKS